MKCVVHDYAGHPFQVQLSRHLARRGHEVIHLYFADNPGPKGIMNNREDDPPWLRFIGVTLGGPVKHAAGTGAQTGFARRFGDVAYGRKVAKVIQTLKPDVVLSGNTPTEAQQVILNTCKHEHIRFVFWLQDVYSMAVSKLLSKQLGYAGKAIGWYYQWLERRQFCASDAIVAISDDFTPLAVFWAGSATKVSVIENWGAIDDIAVGTKDNKWSREHDLCRKFAFVYSGTLGRKQNPTLLLKLAHECVSDETVVVVAQGFGMPLLRAAKAERQLETLTLLPIQPAQHLPDLLATADVLVAMIGSDAGTFAVPSKVLSYLCASRPILLAAPKENLVARIVKRANAGVVVESDDETGFIAAAAQLRADPDLRRKFGANGRAYAERTFNMTEITNKFESVLVRL
jgi:colanic acid biosynthesis glycosyl transferase WcaI